MDLKVNCAYTELVPIGELNPNPKNPNYHPEVQIDFLVKAIDLNGVRAPIVVSKRSGFITKGHGRLEALKRVAKRSGGNLRVPVDYQDYENEQMEYADMVADNQLAELSRLNIDALRKDMKDLFDEDFDFEALGLEDFSLEEEGGIIDFLDDGHEKENSFTKGPQDTIRTLKVSFPIEDFENFEQDLKKLFDHFKTTDIKEILSYAVNYAASNC